MTTSGGLVRTVDGVRDRVLSKVSARWSTLGVRRLVQGHEIDVAIVFVTAILYAVAWPTLQLTHDVSRPFMPIVAALSVLPFLFVRANPGLG